MSDMLLWVGRWAGAIGVSVGLGSYDVAVTIAVFTFLTLRLLTLVKVILGFYQFTQPLVPLSRLYGEPWDFFGSFSARSL